MKTLTITGLVVAGILFAAGTGVIGKTDDTAQSTQEKSCSSCCAAKKSADTQVVATAAKVGEKPACCSQEAATLVSVPATQEKSCDGASCDASGSCCADKAAATMVTTDAAPQEKTCDGSSCDASGSCCADKAATLVTTDAAAKKTCDGSSCSAGGSCCADKDAIMVTTTEGDASEGVCPVTLAMAQLPQLSYTVGEQQVCCEKMAGDLATKEAAAVHYVVAEKTFETKQAAMTALVDQTESMVDAYIKPKTCEVSGATTVAGKACSCPVETAARTKAVEEAAKLVSMKYMVDGQEAACVNCAGARAKETGKPVEYVVAGQATTCEMTARLNLARAKYKAAVEAAVALEKKADATE